MNWLNCYESLNAFKNKLSLWCQRVKRGNYSNFPAVKEIVENNEF